MASSDLNVGALLLYKSQPAELIRLGDKIEINLLSQSQTKRVRPKDISLLHPGPVTKLDIISPDPDDLEEARTLLSGEETTLTEIAELVFNKTTVSAIWSAWQLVTDGIHFHGSPKSIKARTDAEFALEKARRAAKKARRESWQEFLIRVEKKALIDADLNFMREVENLALERGSESRLLQHLGRQQTKENAHALLIELGFWGKSYNPYPQRLEVVNEPPREIPDCDSTDPEIVTDTESERVDLTGLPAFAIDDEGSNDPDDAISFDGERVWVHVADVASLIEIDSPVDLSARSQAATLYLPEGIQTMLPESFTGKLGIGLQETSIALSFAITIDEKSNILALEVIPSRIRVTRLTYKEADALINQNEHLKKISEITKAHRRIRLRADAVEINLPECKVKVTDDQVTITPLNRLVSREMVSEAMLMAGSACALYAKEHEIPMPHAGQVSPNNEMPETCDLAPLVAMFAKRRAMRPGRITCAPQSHFGLGLPAYIRVTSPLRRYLDLVAHQQLRLHLKGATLLNENEITQRIGAVNATSNRIRQAERLSNRHWTLFYLQQHPDWQGEAVVIAEWGRKSLLIIPELALEFEQNLSDNPLPGSHVILSAPRVNLPYLEVFFRSKTIKS